VQLLKFAAQKVHSHVHVDALLAPLGMVSSAAAAAVRVLQHQHTATGTNTSPIAGSKAAAVDAVASAEAADPSTTTGSSELASVAARPLVGKPHAPSPGLSRPPLSPSKRKRATVVEFRLQDVAVIADVCESDQVQLQLGLCKGSSCLEQAVVHGFSLKMNGRELLGIEHLAVTQIHGLVSNPSSFASAAAAAAAAAAGGGLGPAAGGEASRSQGNGSWWDVPRVDSPDLGRGGASWEHGPSSSMESVRVYEEGGGLQSQGSVDDPLPSASLGSAGPKASKDPALFRRQGMRQAAARERCEVRGEAQGVANYIPSWVEIPSRQMTSYQPHT
jgi:hypothetical protein